MKSETNEGSDGNYYGDVNGTTYQAKDVSGQVSFYAQTAPATATTDAAYSTTATDLTGVTVSRTAEITNTDTAMAIIDILGINPSSDIDGGIADSNWKIALSSDGDSVTMKVAYVDKYKVSCRQAIKTICQAGGIPVLAHPGLLRFNQSHQIENFMDILMADGLAGIEVFYTDHDDLMTSFYKDFADKKKLIMTGGSDFHGSFNKGVHLGSGKGNLNIEYSVFNTLTHELEKIKEKQLDFSILENNIGYSFKNKALLNDALCHRSYLNENQDSCLCDNERLEFLGDAVLGLCIGHLLMEKSPSKNEGELSKLRANLVSETALADMARIIDLGRFVKLGKGEAVSRGFDKNSILSDAYEAVIAAAYLDAGFDTTYRLIHDLFKESLEKNLYSEETIDYKSMLQEFVQEHCATTPQYEVLSEIGPDHDKTFEISLNIFDIHSTGFGKTKKAAEQDSAKKALKMLKKINP